MRDWYVLLLQHGRASRFAFKSRVIMSPPMRWRHFFIAVVAIISVSHSTSAPWNVLFILYFIVYMGLCAPSSLKRWTDLRDVWITFWIKYIHWNSPIMSLLKIRAGGQITQYYWNVSGTFYWGGSVPFFHIKVLFVNCTFVFYCGQLVRLRRYFELS